MQTCVVQPGGLATVVDEALTAGVVVLFVAVLVLEPEHPATARTTMAHGIAMLIFMTAARRSYGDVAVAGCYWAAV